MTSLKLHDTLRHDFSVTPDVFWPTFASAMEFDWSLYNATSVPIEEVAESFEDPFSLRLLPDSNRYASQNRFFSLGATNGGKGIFAVYSSTGKIVRVIMARLMTDEESFFYERKSQEYS